MSKVQITCETENANIYYTLNGENPTSNSTLYNSPFEVNEACTVKAIGYKEGYLESDVLEKDLIKLPTPELVNYNTGIERRYFTLSNYKEYPSGTTFKYNVIEYSEESGTMTIESIVKGNGNLPWAPWVNDTFTIVASCPEYIDSDTYQYTYS